MSDIQEINLDDYEQGAQIGKGSHGEVYLATNKHTGKQVAIKHLIAPFSSKEDEDQFYNSIEVYNLNIPGMVKIIGICKKEERFSIVMDYLNNGNAKELTEKYLKSNGSDHEKMNPTIRSKIIYGVATILKQLHEKSVLFNNLTLSKIILDENLEPKL